MPPPFSMRTAIDAMPCDEQREAETRLWTLHCLLQNAYGTQLRDDSLLAYKFATGTHSYPYDNVGHVAHELHCADLIHTKTNYTTQSRLASRERAASLVATHGIPWGDAWKITRFMHMHVIKYDAMREAGLVLPSAKSADASAGGDAETSVTG